MAEFDIPPQMPERPYGANPKAGANRRSTKQIFQGDRTTLRFVATVHKVPATPDNSRVVFTIKQDQFYPAHIWQCTWADFITRLPDNAFGAIEVVIPSHVTALLRRGGYIYSLTSTDKLGDDQVTMEEGVLLVEYSANAPNPEVPYSDPPATMFEGSDENAGKLPAVVSWTM